MNGEFLNNHGEASQKNRFYKGSNQIIKSIEEMIDRCDETLEVPFPGYMRKYTMVFNQTERSNYCKGCELFNNVLEYEGQLCYTPTGNACLGKCLECIYEKGFSIEYKECILSSDICKYKMTLAKFQPLCMKYGLDIGVCNLNSKRILPQTVKQKIICLYLYKNRFCVLWKLNRRSSLLDAVFEFEKIFRYKTTQINDIILKQVIEHKFPTSNEMNCLYNVFASDLETCNVEYSEYCESYGAGVWHPNNFFDVLMEFKQRKTCFREI